MRYLYGLELFWHFFKLEILFESIKKVLF